MASAVPDTTRRARYQVLRDQLGWVPACFSASMANHGVFGRSWRFRLMDLSW